MYTAPSSDHSWLILNLPFKVVLRKIEGFFPDVWSENGALFERFMKIHSNPPILDNLFRSVSLMKDISLQYICWKTKYACQYNVLVQASLSHVNVILHY